MVVSLSDFTNKVSLRLIVNFMEFMSYMIRCLSPSPNHLENMENQELSEIFDMKS